MSAPSLTSRSQTQAKQNIEFAKSRRKKLPSRFLVIDWQAESLVVSAYYHSRSGFDCLKTFSLPLLGTKESGGEALAQAIKTELRRNRIREQNVVVMVPRRCVVLKNLCLPPTDPQEAANAAYFQCESLFPVERNKLRIDILPLPCSPIDENIRLLIAAVPNDIIVWIEETMRGAGLSLRWIGVAELSLPNLSSSEVEETLRLDVLLQDDTIDFLLSNRRIPILNVNGLRPESWNWTLDYLRSTIDHMFSSAAESPDSTEKVSVHFFGNLKEEAVAELRESIRQPIVYHPVATFGQLRDYAMLGGIVRPDETIDFFQPRVPPDPQAKTRQAALRYALVAILLLGVVSLPLLRERDQLRQKIEEARLEQKELKSAWEELEGAERTWKALTALERSKFDYPSEIQGLIGKFYSTELMYLHQLEVSEPTVGSPCIMKLGGKVKDRTTFAALTEDFLKSNEIYRMRPPVLEPNPGDDQYSFRFSMELELSSNLLKQTKEGVSG